MKQVMIVLAAMTLVACGIPLDDGPHEVEIDLDAPVDVTVEEVGELASVNIYLVQEGLISPVTRDLPAPLHHRELLESLLTGVTPPEARAGLRTSIPSGTEVVGLMDEGPEISVDLSREFADVGGEEEILAVAQVVLTLTSTDGVERVRFSLDGVPTAVPLPDGALADDAVEAADYADLLAS